MYLRDAAILNVIFIGLFRHIGYTIEMKKLFYTIWISIYPIIIYTMVQFVLGILIAAAALLYGEWFGAEIDIVDFIADNGLIFTAICATITYIPLIVFYIVDGKNVRNDYIDSANFFDYIMAVLGGAGIAIILNLVISFSRISDFDSQFREVSESLSSPPLIVSLICAGIIVPVVEELIFRGLIFNRIKNQYNTVAAILISSLMFGIYHMNLTQGLYATILGLCIAYVYNKVGNFLIPVMIHMSANIIVLIIGEFGENIEYASLSTMQMIFVLIFIVVLPLISAIAGILYFKRRNVNL